MSIAGRDPKKKGRRTRRENLREAQLYDKIWEGSTLGRASKKCE